MAPRQNIRPQISETDLGNELYKCVALKSIILKRNTVSLEHPGLFTDLSNLWIGVSKPRKYPRGLSDCDIRQNRLSLLVFSVS